MAALSSHRMTAMQSLQAVLDSDNTKLRINTSSQSSSPRSSLPHSNIISGDPKASSLDLVPSNADFPVVASTTARCMQRRRTEKLFERKLAPTLLLRWIRVCTWPVSKGPGRDSGREARLIQ